MSDSDQDKPEEPRDEPQELEEEEEEDEGGLPSWISWGLVVVAAVFGGFLIGQQSGKGSGAGGSAAQLANAREMAVIKQEAQRAMDRNKRAVEDYMRSFSREMILIGLFRDGLDGALGELEKDVAKVDESLAKTGGKPAEQLKQVKERLGKIKTFYDRQKFAIDKVGRIGAFDELLKVNNHHLAYFYLVRVHQLMAMVKTGDKRALREARKCRVNISQLDPKLGQDLDKAYPALVVKPVGGPTSAPATQAAP